MFNNRSTDIVEKTSGISQEKKLDDVQDMIQNQ